MSVPSYLIIAYAIFWLLPLALMLSMWSRQRKIEREIATLSERLRDD